MKLKAIRISEAHQRWLMEQRAKTGLTMKQTVENLIDDKRGVLDDAKPKETSVFPALSS